MMGGRSQKSHRKPPKDLSIVTGRGGGYKKRGGYKKGEGACQVLPLERKKWGGVTLKWQGQRMFCGSFNMGDLKCYPS